MIKESYLPKTHVIDNKYPRLKLNEGIYIWLLFIIKQHREW